MLGSDVTLRDARDALQRVLASPEFATASRLSAFLTYVVSESLDGRAANLKGYSIAVDVFDRPADFDQTSDPIVRVEASRLRRALAQYYQGSGTEDPVIIDLPRGGYVPGFRRRVALAEPQAEPVDVPAAVTPPPAITVIPAPGVLRFRRIIIAALVLIGLAIGYLVWKAATAPESTSVSSSSSTIAGSTVPPPPEGVRFQPVIGVMELSSLSGDEADTRIARGLTQELVTEIARFQEFVVYPLPENTPPPFDGYLLSGSVRHVGGNIRVTMQLSAAADRRALWTETYDRVYSLDSLLSIQEEIARAVATAIGQPYGVIYAREASGAAARPESLDGYKCVLSVYEYWRSFDPAVHTAIRACLEKTVQDEPDYVDAWQMLTFVYLDEYRYGYNARPLTQYRPLDKALEAAQRAVALAATDARSYESLYAAYFYRGDIEAFRRAGADARRLNPNSPEIMADFGNKLVAIGSYDEGVALIRKAITLNPAHPGWYNIGLVLDAYRRGSYAEALAAAERMNMPKHYRSWVFFAMIYGQTDDVAQARGALEELLKLQPDFALNARTDLRKWGLRDRLVEQCIDGLRKAGLDIPGP